MEPPQLSRQEVFEAGAHRLPPSPPRPRAPSPGFLSLRWKKAFRDLWWEKTRTLLVILSIAIGLFTFGVIIGARNLVTSELPVRYNAVHPAAATIHVSPAAPFNDALVASVTHVPGVGAADGRFAATVRYRDAAGQWRDLKLYALDDYEAGQVDVVHPWQGAWPPPDHAILLERNSLPQMGLAAGDDLWLETADGHARRLPIAGLTHDMNQAPAQVTGIPYGYVSGPTLEWLGLPPGYNELHLLVAERPLDKAHIQAVARAVADKLERDGHPVIWTQVPEPGEHFVQDFLPAIILIMGVMGFLALLLSVLLAVNVIVAILVQQTRQIGVMKAVGGRRSQIAGIYLRMVLIFGLAAVAVAVPLSVLGAHAFSRFIAGQLNFDLDRVRVVPSVLMVEVAVGLLVPLFAALPPIHAGTRVTVREAMSDYGLEKQAGGPGRLERLLVQAQAHAPLGHPTRLALRNVFRRKGRLARTLLALMLAGAMFMTVWAVRASLFRTLEATLDEQSPDVQVQMTAPRRVTRLAGLMGDLPDVSGVEYWSVRSTVLLRPDGTDGDAVLVNGLPADTRQFSPDMVAGRWLAEGDARVVVVPEALLADEPDLKLGGPLRLRLGDEELEWTIVGVRRSFQPPLAPALVYVDAAELAQVAGRYDHADTVRLQTTDDDAATQAAALAAAEARLAAAGIEVRSTRTGAEDRRIFTERFNILTVILLALALLLGTVGGLGLMGTMSINVLERRREIGVMRAIGASNGAVMRVVVVEGVAVGLMSWVGALIVAQPLSRFMAAAVGGAFLNRPLSYAFDWRAPLMWIAIVIVIAALSSLLPALSAARLSVRETLAYE